MTVASVGLYPEHDLFIVAQTDGLVHFKTLKEYSHVCYLNQAQ